MIPGGNGYSVDIAALSGTPGLLVVLTGEDQQIMSWNDTAAGLFGVPAAQALGQPVADSEFLLQATGLRVPLEHGTGTLWLSHLPGQGTDQRALEEALTLAAAELRRLTMIAVRLEPGPGDDP